MFEFSLAILTFLIISSLFFLYKGITLRKMALKSINSQKSISFGLINAAPLDAATSLINDVVSSSGDLSTRKLHADEILTRTAAEIGLGNIEFLLTQIISEATPYLFGVNKGGGFIANYLAQRLSLHEKFLVKCDYRTDIEKLYCEDREIDGPIVIIDDIARTGKTLHFVKDYLTKKYPENSIYCFTLVVACDNANRYELFNLIDYSPWVTENKDITLPWTRSSKINSKEYFNDMEMDQIIGRILIH